MYFCHLIFFVWLIPIVLFSQEFDRSNRIFQTIDYFEDSDSNTKNI